MEAGTLVELEIGRLRRVFGPGERKGVSDGRSRKYVEGTRDKSSEA